MGLQFFYKKTRYGEAYLEEIAAIEDYDAHDLQNVQRYERLNEGGWNLTGEALVKFKRSEWIALPTEQFEVYDFYPKHSYDYSSFHHSDPYAPPEPTDPEPADPADPEPTVPDPVVHIKYAYEMFESGGGLSERMFVIRERPAYLEPAADEDEDMQNVMQYNRENGGPWVPDMETWVATAYIDDMTQLTLPGLADLDFVPLTPLEFRKITRPGDFQSRAPGTGGSLSFLPEGLEGVLSFEPEKQPFPIAIVMGLAMGAFLAFR